MRAGGAARPKVQSATMLLVLDEMAGMLQDFLESLHEEPDEEDED